MNISRSQSSIFTVPTTFLAKQPSTKPPSPARPGPLSRRSSTPDYRQKPRWAHSAAEQTQEQPSSSSAQAQAKSAVETLQKTPWSSGKPDNTRPTLQHRSISYSDLKDFSEGTTNSSPRSGTKRVASVEFDKSRSRKEERAVKRIRFSEKLKYTPISGIPLGNPVDSSSPTSPLFFSNHPPQRPPLPSRYSSSEVAMLSSATGEDNVGFKTVKLARGSYQMASSPPLALSPPSGLVAGKRPSIPRRDPSDGREKTGGYNSFNQVGVIELLEQDDRPTFVVDLANPAIFHPGPLQIIFANASLRIFSGLLDLITGKTDRDSPGLPATATYPEFKTWCLSFVKGGEALDVPLPSFFYGGVTWSCSTLRKRFRLMSGNPHWSGNGIISNPPTSVLPTSSTNTHGSSSSRPSKASSIAVPVPEEPDDYFGNAGPPMRTSTGASEKSAVSSLESPGHVIQTVDIRVSSNELLAGDKNKKYSSSSSSASLPGTSLNEAVLSAAITGQADDSSKLRKLDQGYFDWTRLPIMPSLPRHVQFARSVDWASTSLGPIENWSTALRGMCNLIMASPYPAAMYWGEDLIAIYNEAYIMLAGNKHPQLMGQSYKVAWAEIWSEVEDVFANARSTGQATMKDDDCLFIKRSDTLEETYFSWSIIPLVGEDGSVVGLYNPCFEKTRRKLAERRMLTLREVGERTAAAREVKSFWGQVLQGLEYNVHDTPFVLLYSVSDDVDSDASSIHSNSVFSSKQCLLEGALGIPQGHRVAPAQIDLKAGMEGFGQVFREAMKTDRPILVQTADGTLDEKLLEGIDWRGFGDSCSSATVCPIHPTTGDAVLGFLVMGINPRRPYDDDYDLFVQLLSRQLATSMASVVLFEEEIRRGQRAAKLAALDRIELSEQLAARTQEAVESETKFTRMAEFAPVGMFIANSEGRIIYCNDTWYEITRCPREESSQDRWMDWIKEDDQDAVKESWVNLVENTVPLSTEFRFKAPWKDRNGVKGDTWVLASAYPEKGESGSVKSIFGSITNISQQKWAEGLQKKRMEEAVEMKRQQENFIDITSHEMRNPLSAILQCADEISSSLNDFKSTNGDGQITMDLVESNIDAATTIALCAQHQKRIVDDILTLSKLDSALLLVTPVDIQLVAVIQRALKMFDNELQTSDIKMEFKVDRSLKDLDIDWIRLDPSRILQVLINLTTNAIKFTTTQAKRKITVTLSAFIERPSTSDKRVVSYFPTRSAKKDLVQSPDWGDGEEIFVHVAVEDTGRGLNDSEKKLLFIRFSQASPRTHVQYGGSGLGLFISRELVELQGGEIGVASESGKGSTFAFYVKARKSSAPENSEQIAAAKERQRARKNVTTRLSSSNETTNGSSSSKPASRDVKHQLKVLIVEDNLVNQRVLQKQLRNLGCVTYLANHGGECIERLKESRFWKGRETNGLEMSVILMDWEMPVMDGLTCARKIRDLEKAGEVTRHVPIIGVTANARGEQINTALDAGIDDVVSKPFRIPDLIPKIEELLEKLQNGSSRE